MLKILITGVFINSFLFANTHVGESVNYAIKGTSGGDGTIATVVKDFDAETKSYIVNEVTSIAGHNENETYEIEEDEIFSHEKAEEAILYCAILDGTPELLTVMEKEYYTCKVEMDLENIKIDNKFFTDKEGMASVWIGDFPVIGIGKIQTEKFTMEITDMKWN